MEMGENTRKTISESKPRSGERRSAIPFQKNQTGKDNMRRERSRIRAVLQQCGNI